MFSYQSIKEYHSALQNAAVSCASVVEHYLQQIDSAKHLNAFVEVYSDEARARARELDAKREQGSPIELLHGVVVALKDVIVYKGHKVSAASKILTNYSSPYSATAVQRLLDAGVIIIGTTNCDEFAMGSTNENSVYGPVLNAVNEAHVPGGSSGGAAVAVQAGMCMVSLGSDTGGSVRQPADFCGIAGLKPTYGRVSRYGLIAYASSFDQIGIFGNNIEDIATVLEVISGTDQFDSTASEKPVEPYSSQLDEGSRKYKVAYFRQAIESPALDPEIRRSIQDFLAQLEKDGHQVAALEFDLIDYIVPTYYILTTAESSSNLSRFDGVRYGYRHVDKNNDLKTAYRTTRSEGFGKEVKRRIMLGTFVLSAGYYDAYYSKAQKVRRILQEKTNLIFRDFDAIILPTSPSTAFRLDEKSKDPIAMYMADIFTVFSNLTGIPSISLPLFWHSNGMPYGLQVMTNHFSELSLLRLSNQWMKQYSRTGH